LKQFEATLEYITSETCFKKGKRKATNLKVVLEGLGRKEHAYILLPKT
jgi:hypothetical protein